ncbi:3-methyl-2-oxobutanoate hydroxymethyltransferase [Mycolicibacterium smegmatis]|uniref:3-methyl-2-oxobutanoate hydroxymethyltransferase n=1 Tax=Mycolicibacterium smegmatis TaxID=1772 RepID=UPI001E2E4E1E|nr:3-methyl-2-oxobutanoate hydroxymethyltransferase [Mycolicibacterium smegmatis]UGU31842.1 3-methyl-2-oxobutanoate hydroxymethyltransferase [Mycolicibacterium smegmatis]ULN37589.1 3-methyl-2-oxobutanoate hydroxymethyltransferase [Mycolicibacterium smegmatis]ULN72731.1 3-methyl-2-oxobutanoate hydroxymethyltransferase [Mycolicibacterium smegmatis]
MSEKVHLGDLRAMKQQGRKIVGVVAWDYQMARIVDRAGVDIVSVGDTVGINLWGQPNPLEVTTDQMILVCQAVRRGVRRALLSVDFPFGPVQEGPDEAVRAAIRFVKEAGVDMVKLDGASDHLEAVSAVTRAGIPVFAQFGITPQTSLKYGVTYSATPKADDAVPDDLLDEMVGEAKRLEAAGAALLNFTNSGPVVGPAVAQAVSIPVLGGFGGGPWLDGRVRMATAAIGYSADGLDAPPDTYANVAQIAFDAISAYAHDVRAARQIAGGIRT